MTPFFSNLNANGFEVCSLFLSPVYQGKHLPADSEAPSGFIVVQQGCFSFGLKSFLDTSKHANVWVCVSVRVCMHVVLHYAQMAGVEVVVASEKTKRTFKVPCFLLSPSLFLSLSVRAPSSVVKSRCW